MNKLKNRSALVLSALAMAAVLSACGGGGADAGSSPFNTGTTATPVVSENAAAIYVSVNKTIVQNTDSTPVVATVQIVNSAGLALAGRSVAVRVDGAVGPSTPVVTDKDGKATIPLDYTNSKANRVVVAKITAAGLSDEATFVVSGVQLATRFLPAIVVPGGSGQVEVDIKDSAGNVFSNTPIKISLSKAFSGSGVVISSAQKTSSAGKAVFDYTVPANFTGASLAFDVEGGGFAIVNQGVSVQQSSGPAPIPAVLDTIGTAAITLSRNVVEVNADGGTTNQVEVVFKAFSTADPPVPMQNIRVSFDLKGDPSKTGGKLSAGTNLLYTNSEGIASTTFTPGKVSTGESGMRIYACYSGSDFVPDLEGDAAAGTSACPSGISQSLTITNSALSVSIAPEGLVAKTSDGRYATDFVVNVVNAAGEAKPNVAISAVLDLPGFEKGFYERPSDSWVQVLTLPSNITYADRDSSSTSYLGCRNEDINRDGIRSFGEDADNDGKLEPAKADASFSFVDDRRLTDVNGSVKIRVTYFKNVAGWLRVKLYASAAVSGTEGNAKFASVLLPPIDDVKAEGRPPFADNPYGSSTSCTTH